MVNRKLRLTVALAFVSLGATACADSGSGDSGDGFAPEAVEFMVHTDPGGGSDLFARGATATMEGEGIIDKSSWTVVNENGGSGASAMATLAGMAGENETVAVATPTWQTTPLTVPEASVTIDQLTPIAQMVTEPTIMAVKGDSPLESLEDYLEAARKDPGGLVQTGGSVTAIDALAGALIMEETGTDWEYLSFEGGGERITAILNGDADMMFTAPAEVSEQVRAGELKVIATIGEEPSLLFPDAPTLSDSGVDVETPQQLRGIVGPPDMSSEAVAYYEKKLEELTNSEAWAEYCEKNGIVPVFEGAEEWSNILAEQNTLLRDTLEKLDLLVE